MFSFFKKKQEEKPKSLKPVLVKEDKKELYLVLNKRTDLPLGIYDSLEKAKSFGQKSTYHDCKILNFELNSECKFYNNPVYEDI